jgi:hypothetical protein
MASSLSSANVNKLSQRAWLKKILYISGQRKSIGKIDKLQIGK